MLPNVTVVSSQMMEPPTLHSSSLSCIGMEVMRVEGGV